MRKIITLSAELCERHGLSDWRQQVYNVKHVKRLMRTAQNKKHVSAKTEEQQEKREALIVEAHQEYIDVAQTYLHKCIFLRRGPAIPADVDRPIL